MDDTTFSPGPTPTTVLAADGSILTAPAGWALLPPGDAGLTRRVKAAGDHWVVQEKVGRRTFSRGVWAASATIERIRAELEVERSTEGYARKQEAASRRREVAQAESIEDIQGVIVGFHPGDADLAVRPKRGDPEHAAPVGSGTVARTAHPGGIVGRGGRRRLAATPDVPPVLADELADPGSLRPRTRHRSATLHPFARWGNPEAGLRLGA